MLKEEPFFYKNGDYKLFGMLHYPYNCENDLSHQTSSAKKNCGIVFCCPFAEEKLWSHRIFVNFARYLSRNGYTVLRFDYMGNGDSEGNFEDSTIETNLSDIAKSIEVIKKMGSIDEVGLLGLRLGATLAVVSAKENNDIDFLVLWEPIIKVKEYLQQCLRSNLTTQMVTYKKIVKTRKEITDDLLNRKAANIDGYLMSGEFYKQASKIDLSHYDFCFSEPVQFIQISINENVPIKKDLIELYEKRFRNENKNSEISAVKEEPFWREIKTFYRDAPNLFDKTLCWIEKITEH
jgi:uncharacterized protein